MVRASAAQLDEEATTGEARTLPLPRVEDATLVARALTGERWAKEAIFRRHVEYVMALSLRLLRDQAEAEDIVQDTFVDAFTQLRQLQAPDRLRAWLAGIAVHKAHRRFRRRRLLSLFGLRPAADWVGLEDTARADVPPEARAELGYLDAVLSTLREEIRAAWILRHVEGYRFEEIAALCQCSLATAKRRVARAHAVVREQLNVEEDEHG